MIKLVSLFVLGSGMLMAMPPIPDLPSADTGTFSDTGSEPDTGGSADTGEDTPTDTGTNPDLNTPTDTGSEPDTGSATDPEGTTGDNNTYSASQLANEKGGGCSVTAASQGSWLFGLFGLLALGRRKGE